MKAIILKNIEKSFSNKRLFDRFNLEIDEGDMVALVGASGCGKTTLLNMIGLIEPTDKGEYYIFNKKAPKCNSFQSNAIIRDYISYLFQNFALVDNFTVEENLMLSLKYVKKNKQQKKLMINKALKRVGLENYNKLKVFQISGGEQQRVALARAMIKPGKIILADEPTGSLDYENKYIVMKILKELNNNGKTIIIVTHDLEVAKLCNHIIEL